MVWQVRSFFRQSHSQRSAHKEGQESERQRVKGRDGKVTQASDELKCEKLDVTVALLNIHHHIYIRGSLLLQQKYQKQN